MIAKLLARRPKTAQRGQTLVLFALILGLVLFPLFSAAVDYGQIAEANAEADGAVMQASSTGASQLDLTNYRNGSLSIDRNSGKSACEAALAAQLTAYGLDQGANYSCTPNPATGAVTSITATATVHPRTAIGSRTWFSTTVTRTAYPGYGIFSPS